MNDTTPFFEPLFDELSPLNLPDLTDSFSQTEQTAATDGEKFVVFFLEGELFALPAAQITEIVRPLDFTPLPNSPAWLHGIANLRGEIISVLNLSKICGRRGAADSPKSRFIVLKARGATAVAFPVDRLSEIITFNKRDIQPAPDARFYGRAVYKTGMIDLLDTERLFSSLVLS
jgi:purine-binding chemotaxis protein CheW